VLPNAGCNEQVFLLFKGQLQASGNYGFLKPETDLNLLTAFNQLTAETDFNLLTAF